MSNETPSNTEQEQVRSEVLQKKSEFDEAKIKLGERGIRIAHASNNPDISLAEQKKQIENIEDDIKKYFDDIDKFIASHSDFFAKHMSLYGEFNSLKLYFDELSPLLSRLSEEINKVLGSESEQDEEALSIPDSDDINIASNQTGTGDGQGGPPKQETLQSQEYPPHMGKYDTAKRFLLSEQVNLFEYEQVKDWGQQEIISAISLYFDMWMSDNMHPEKPFDAMRLMDTPVQIRKSDGEVLDVSARKALTDLGAETSRIFEYRLGAVEKVLAQGAEFSEVRNEQNMSTIVKTATMEKAFIQGLFDLEAKGEKDKNIEIRPYGVAVTEAEILRLVLASMHKRLFNGKKQMFAHESGKRKKMIEAWGQIKEGLVKLLKEINSQKDSSFWIDKKEEDLSIDEDRLKRIAEAAIIKAYNLGDLLFFRVLHDVDASRYDILLPSLWAQLRRAQEKYFDIRRKGEGQGEELGGILGQLKSQETSHIAFWEGIWQPLVVREHTMVHYLVREKVKDEDDENEHEEVRIKASLMNLEAALCLNPDLKEDGSQLGKIPDRSNFSDEEREKLAKLYKDIEEAKDEKFNIEKVLKKPNLNDKKRKKLDKKLVEAENKIKENQEELQNLDFLNYDEIPLNEDGSPLIGGGLVITTFEDFLKDVYPSDAPKHELDIIAHAEAVWKVLTDFDLDLDRLTVKTPRLIGGGEYVNFDPDEARKISGALRSAFYYLFGDYVRSNISEREYLKLKDNYQEPQRADFDDTKDGKMKYDEALKRWEYEHQYRGAPIKTFKREKGSNILELDDDENPVITYNELFVNHLYNLSLDYEKRVAIGLFTPREADFYKQDHARVFGAEDQQLAWQKIAVEKLVMAVVKAYDESREKQFTAEHLQALVEAMSYSAYKSNRQGINTLLLRKKAGAYGLLEGDGETYLGAGPWRRDEAINMVRAILGDRAFYMPKKKQ